MLRIRADDPDARVPLGLKYGANLEDVPRLLQHAKGLGLKVRGSAEGLGLKVRGSAEGLGLKVRGGARSWGLNVLPPHMREVHDGLQVGGKGKGGEGRVRAAPRGRLRTLVKMGAEGGRIWWQQDRRYQPGR